MDERRKIIIPIGADADSKSDQTYFDTQARKDAVPVVPLSGVSSTGAVAPATRSGKRALIVVFLVTAFAAASVAGAYVYLTRDRGQTGPQAAVPPVAGKSLSTLSWTHTPGQPDADESETTDNDENSDATANTKTARASETRAESDRAANDNDARNAGKKQKRGKTGNKNDDDETVDPVKRTTNELHRIREIFEGPP